MTCLLAANTGTCDATDVVCLCHSDAFIQSTTQCFYGACTGDQLEQALAAGREGCAAVVRLPFALSPSPWRWR